MSWDEWERRYQVKPPRDATGRWRKEVRKLARRLGWQEDMLWLEWEQMAGMAECELGIPRAVAENTGFRLLRCFYDKLEMEMDVH